MRRERFEVGRDIGKDENFKVAYHVTEFHVSEAFRVRCTHPILNWRWMFTTNTSGMFAFNTFAIEWRVPYSIVGTIEVGTDEKEHVEE